MHKKTNPFADYIRLRVSITLVVLIAITLFIITITAKIEHPNTMILIFIGVTLIAISIWMAWETHRVTNQYKKLRQKEKQMHETVKMRTEFLQVASHQLRAPLTSLYGLVELDAAGYFHELPAEKHKAFHDDMLDSAKHLKNLVNELLSALRLEGKDLPLTFEKTTISEVIQKASEIVKNKYEEKHLKLNIVKPKKETPTIEADKDYLQQALINILDNAQRYTKQGGVTVTTSTTNNAIIIDISDTGIGITKDEKQELFQKFARSDRAKKTQAEGTGLGLFIANKIVVGHHGNLELLSEGKNKGTTARITIPIKHQSVHYHLFQEESPGN